jgi:hypothetical protein
LKALEPVLKTHNVHVFILSDKLVNGNYSPENEVAIRKILDGFYVNVWFDYVENYPMSMMEEKETAEKYFSTIKNTNGSSLFTPRLIYREYLLNKLKNQYLQKNISDLTIYCRLFDINIWPNLSCDEISKQVDICYQDPSILYGSSDTFFIGSCSAMDYLFSLAMKIKNGELYHDIWNDPKCVEFISSMDYALTQCKATYSPEIMIISHMYYGPFRYINMRVDFTNPDSQLNLTCMYHVKLDPRRK